jgi:hypothetical protein
MVQVTEVNSRRQGQGCSPDDMALLHNVFTIWPEKFLATTPMRTKISRMYTRFLSEVRADHDIINTANVKGHQFEIFSGK